MRDSADNGPPEIVIDFGQNVAGILNINFAGSQNKTDGLPGLRLAFSETLEFLTNRSDFTRSDNARGEDKLTNGTDQIAVQNEPYTWRDLLGCQFEQQKVCSDGLHGFRYVKLWLEGLPSDAPYISSTGSIAISSVRLEWSAFLGTPESFTGWFECSNEELTQWWYDGVYTVDLGTDVFLANETEPRDARSPSLEGKQVLFDGAKRDRDPYVGDLAVASLTSYLSHDFAESTRNVLEDLALHQRADGWIPPASINNYSLPLFDYPLWWVVCSVDFTMYSGNTSYVEAYWPAILKVIDEYYPKYMEKDTGLLVKSAEMGYGDYAFLPRSGPVTYYNALYVHTLRYTSTLAAVLGRTDDAHRWASRAETLSKAVRKHNFDSRVKAFYDGGSCPNDKAGTYCDVHAQDGNSLAIISGIADKNTSTQILDYWHKAAARPYGNAFYDSSVLSPDDQFADRVYAFISYFELQARLMTPGASNSAFDEISRLYGWMSSHDPKITMWEGIGPNGSAYQGAFTSMAHGWSTGIVPLLSNHVLGVVPTKPGFKRWRICPVLEFGDVSWAKGEVPTPHGALGVSWAKRGHEQVTFNITVPHGTSGVLCLPEIGLRNRNVTVNGAPVAPDTFTQSRFGIEEEIPGVSLGEGAYSVMMGVA
ncbi:alpha-L-rhamnosidase A [Purpureocillium lavendulum]|uniref:Alpha-L-rhamnosidase A n=1 Tax=Purpureocillium lavendulum TaxID=1247861 RepID=A0AB34FFE5_9HYPO|nr:alpha-L-rhamnosidase A [Purpureocillium lavendulum]